MIPSTNGNSAPKGCNPISSNCVIWQGPDLPCIDLCTGDSISSVVAKLCQQLIADVLGLPLGVFKVLKAYILRLEKGNDYAQQFE